MLVEVGFHVRLNGVIDYLRKTYGYESIPEGQWIQALQRKFSAINFSTEVLIADDGWTDPRGDKWFPLAYRDGGLRFLPANLPIEAGVWLIFAPKSK